MQIFVESIRSGGVFEHDDAGTGWNADLADFSIAALVAVRERAHVSFFLLPNGEYRREDLRHDEEMRILKVFGVLGFLCVQSKVLLQIGGGDGFFEIEDPDGQ